MLDLLKLLDFAIGRGARLLNIIMEHQDGSSSSSSFVASIGWSVEWCRAFPTLLTHDVYCSATLLAPHLYQLAWSELYPDDDDFDDNDTTMPETVDWQDSLGYGEIVPSTVFWVLDWIQNHCSPQPIIKTVHDLGSGDGKVIMATALVLASQTECVLGIEIMPHRHEQALQRLHEYKRRTPDGHRQCSSIEFQCRDFCELQHEITNAAASLIWIHGTVFGEKLFGVVQDICESCPSQTLFVMISKPLVEGNEIETLLEAHLPLSWGIGLVFVQRRR